MVTLDTVYIHGGLMVEQGYLVVNSSAGLTNVVPLCGGG